MHRWHLAATTAAAFVGLSTSAHADIQVVSQASKAIYIDFYYVPAPGASLAECGYKELQPSESASVNFAAACMNKPVSLYVRSFGAPVGTGCELHSVAWADGRLTVTGSATMSVPLRCSPY